ncbi:MAG: hypothetical protein OEZ22_10140 [Spirochaetia bacterium]|nr:hypothetical protein [Spirochaetia bacterium]
MKNLIIYIFLILFLSLHCKESKEWLLNWQKKEIERRYGKSTETDLDTIKDWQSDIKEYEEIINKKIEAGVNAGKLYRKIGESYAVMNSFELCIENLNKSISFGYNDPEIYFSLGICYGNLSQKNNWQYEYAKNAEESFLKSLNLDSEFDKAKFELSLIYFYAFGSNNKYRVLSDYLTVTQKEYREKAIMLMQEFQFHNEKNIKSYFALAGMYKILNKPDKSIEQMKFLISLLEKLYPKNYTNMPEYKKAAENLSLLIKSQ